MLMILVAFSFVTSFIKPSLTLTLLMLKNKWYLLLLLLMNVLIASAQPALKHDRLFEDDKLITMDLSTDLKKLVSEKKAESSLVGSVTHFQKPNDNLRISTKV